MKITLQTLMAGETSASHFRLIACAFLQRYIATPRSLTVSDHRLHLTQLYCIYQALETELARYAAIPTVSLLTAGLLDRTTSIKQDMDFLDTRLSPEERHQASYLADSTRTLEGIIHTKTSPAELLGFFLASTLADLFGGQNLKKSVQAVLDSGEDGIASYSFKSVTATSLLGLLEKIDWSEKEGAHLLAEFQASFLQHEKIYAEIEAHRKSIVPKPADKHSSSCVFYVAATVVSVAAIALGKSYFFG